MILRGSVVELYHTTVLSISLVDTHESAVRIAIHCTTVELMNITYVDECKLLYEYEYRLHSACRFGS